MTARGVSNHHEPAHNLSPTWLEAIPVARNIPAAHVTDGRTCAILFFDASNPSDAVVVAVYG